MRLIVRVLTISALAMGAATAAQAQVTAINGGSPSQATVGVVVRASVAARCEFTTGRAPAGARSLGDITRPFTADFPFSLRCNTPARVAVASANGGLRTPDVLAGPGYAALAPYEVELTLAGDQGQVAQAACASAALAAGGSCAFRGPASSTAGLRFASLSSDATGSNLRVRSVDLSGVGVLAASPNYSDRLVVTISPAT